MKILIVPSYDSFGGTRTFFLKLLNIHTEAEIETGVIIEKKQRDMEILNILAKKDVTVFTTYNRSRLFTKPKLSWLSDIVSVLYGFVKFSPDIIVISNTKPGIMLGALIFPVPVIYIMHGYPQKKHERFLRFPWPFIFSFPKNYFATVSKYSANLISRNMGIALEKIKVIHNSYGKVAKKESGGMPLVLTLGYVVQYKNTEAWLKVAKKVIKKKPETIFIWLGDGPELESMRQQVKLEGYERNIFFKGYCSDVLKYYAKAWVYFQPSLIENHGISIVEAMAHGLPCVCSNVGGMPESVTDKETGYLCNPEDINGFTQKIISLIENQDLRNKMGNAARIKALNSFSENTQKQNILQLYKTALSPHKNPN